MYYLVESNINEYYLYNNIKLGVENDYEWFKCDKFFTNPTRQAWTITNNNSNFDINELPKDIVYNILNIIQKNDYVLYVISSEYNNEYEHKYCFIYGKLKPNTPVKHSIFYSALNMGIILQLNTKINNMDNKINLLENRITELLKLLYKNFNFE
jgi:hypothetical protein